MMQGYKLLQLLTALLICHFVAANHEHGHARTDHQKRAHYAPNSNTYWSRQQMQEPSKGPAIEGDELILSGDGSGCWDDEDCTTFPTEAGSGDDLITPRVLHVSPRPTQASHGPRGMPATRPTRPTDEQGCGDDEDCVEGSGAGEPRRRSTTSTTLAPPPMKPYPTGAWPSRPLPEPPGSSSGSGYSYGASRPSYAQAPAPSPTPLEEDRSGILYTSRPIPPAMPVYPARSYPKPRPSPPPRPTGRPVIVDVPKPMRPQIPHQVEMEKTRLKPTTMTTSYSKSSADRTALIIGLIAVILIVIVIIAPIIVVIKVRYRSGTTGKAVVDRKNYQFAPVSGTPPLLAANASGSVTHLNGNPPLPGEYKQAPKLPKKKDLKEWYV